MKRQDVYRLVLPDIHEEFKIERKYESINKDISVLGRGWKASFDSFLEIKDDNIKVMCIDGYVETFDLINPDQIAGGNPLNVTGMGNKKINSSIGSQWRTRADDVEKQVREYIQNNDLSPGDLENIHLNIKLSYWGGR